jgi:hypothetical protein
MSNAIHDLIPENTAVEIERLELRIGGQVPGVFARDTQLIATKWQKRSTENPHLFNGTVYLLSGLQLENGRLHGEAVELDYASFLHWRGNQEFQAEADLYHAFPLAAIESSDGKLVAVRAAKTTINSGLVYFAAGMFDENDVMGTQLDPTGNMRREVSEETGLNLGQMVAEGALVAFRTGRFVALFQRYLSQRSASQLVSQIEAYASAQATPEIEGAVVIARKADIVQSMPSYMQAYCHWCFDNRVIRGAERQ